MCDINISGGEIEGVKGWCMKVSVIFIVVYYLDEEVNGRIY